jgi:hypothetical protein
VQVFRGPSGINGLSSTCNLARLDGLARSIVGPKVWRKAYLLLTRSRLSFYLLASSNRVGELTTLKLLATSLR